MRPLDWSYFLHFRLMPPEAFVSFAQNGEDIVLWRALRHIRTGVYVDVGGLIGIAAMLAVFLFSAARNTRTLYRAEPLKGGRQ